MIELRTGIPGSGKTLSMVEALARLVARWSHARYAQELRPVYVLGIEQLAIPGLTWFPLPGSGEKDAVGKWLTFVPDWAQVPDGALVIIDECQAVFPPRSTQSKPPPHVAWLNTHRHRGIDLWLTTQGPKLLDYSVRELVGKHLHYRRLFGGQRAAVYEWDSCEGNVKAAARDAVVSYYPYPKGRFRYYRSAEVHTKQTFKLPRWLIVPVLGVLGSIYAIPHAYGVLSGTLGGKSQLDQAVKPVTAASSAPTTVAAPAATVVAPKHAQPAASTPAAARPATPLGCVTMGARCLCIAEDGRAAPVEPAACVEGATTLAGLVPLNLEPSTALPGPAEPRPQATTAPAGAVGWNAGDFRDRYTGRYR